MLVTDLDSRNGTSVGEERLPANVPTCMNWEDSLCIGRHTFRLTLHSRDEEEDEDEDGRDTKSYDSLPPLPFGEFKILGVIGEGRNGRVFAAEHLLMRRRVAIKVLDSRYDEGTVERARFLREGRIGAQIQSPHIVDVYDVRVVAGQVCLIMELVQGPSALDRLQNGPLPLRDVMKIGEDIAMALQAADDFGVVHRDIKPSNILLDPCGVAKLTDFGMAKSLDPSVGTVSVRKAKLGALSYFSPEQQLSWHDADVRSDIYSLGATLYHLVRGAPLGASPSEADRATSIHSEFEPLFMSMLHEDPVLRPFPPKHLARMLRELRVRFLPDSTGFRTYQTGHHAVVEPGALDDPDE